MSRLSSPPPLPFLWPHYSINHILSLPVICYFDILFGISAVFPFFPSITFSNPHLTPTITFSCGSSSWIFSFMASYHRKSFCRRSTSDNIHSFSTLLLFLLNPVLSQHFSSQYLAWWKQWRKSIAALSHCILDPDQLHLLLNVPHFPFTSDQSQYVLRKCLAGKALFWLPCMVQIM